MSARNVTPFDLARVLRVSEQELIGLTKQGVLHRTTEKRNGRERIVYDWRENVGAYVEHQGSPAEEARKAYLFEKSETQRIIRAHRELELARARGELIDGELVDREVMNVLSSIKNHMRALPSRISSLLVGLSRAEIHALVKKYVDLTLREASDFDLMQLRGSRNGNGQHDRGENRTKKKARRSSRA
jgi:hypothetical protein